MPLGGGHVMYWEQAGSARGVAGAVPARRTRCRSGSGAPAVLRPELLADRDLRPARGGAVAAAGELGAEHDADPGRGHRDAAPASRDRAVAAVRGVVGQHAGAGVCAGVSGAGARAGAARGVPGAGRSRWSGSCMGFRRCFPTRMRRSWGICRRRSGRTCWARICGG